MKALLTCIVEICRLKVEMGKASSVHLASSLRQNPASDQRQIQTQVDVCRCLRHLDCDLTLGGRLPSWRFKRSAILKSRHQVQWRTGKPPKK